MADFPDHTDKTTAPVEQSHNHNLENVSQGMSKPAEAGSASHSHADIAKKSSAMVDAAILPAAQVVDDGKVQAGRGVTADAAADSKQVLDRTASEVADSLKHYNAKDAEGIANVINKGLDQGVNLKDLVTQINSDMPTNTTDMNYLHGAVFNGTDGKEQLAFGVSPFPAVVYNFDGKHIAPAYPAPNDK